MHDSKEIMLSGLHIYSSCSDKEALADCPLGDWLLGGDIWYRMGWSVQEREHGGSWNCQFLGREMAAGEKSNSEIVLPIFCSFLFILYPLIVAAGPFLTVAFVAVVNVSQCHGDEG